MAMLTIGGGCETIRNFVAGVIESGEHASMGQFTADDFAGVSYKVVQDYTTPTKFRIDATFEDLEGIRAAGGTEVLESDYAGLEVESDSPNTVSLSIDLEGTLPCPKEELADKLAHLGRNLVGAPVLLAMRALKAGNLAEMSWMKIGTSSNGDCMYVSTTASQVSVCYVLNFRDEADIAVAKVLLQEMSEARGSPSIRCNEECEIAGAGPSNVGYATISANARLDLEKAVTQFVYFPAFLDYHVKATKAFLHSRMRNRVNELLKVLNRARPEMVSKVSKSKSRSSRRGTVGSGAGAGAGAGAGSRFR